MARWPGSSTTGSAIVTASSSRSTAGRPPSQNEARWWGRCLLDRATPGEVALEESDHADDRDAVDAESIVKAMRSLRFPEISLFNAS